MAIRRERPYVQFNFLVGLGDGRPGEPTAGFQEVWGIGTGTDITLKRGVIDAAALSIWLDRIRHGDGNGPRTVTITLQNEDHSAAVASWQLVRARIVKHTMGPMNALATDVAVEELVLACDRVEPV